jgi:hypothetical protein
VSLCVCVISALVRAVCFFWIFPENLVLFDLLISGVGKFAGFPFSFFVLKHTDEFVFS